MRSYDIAVIPGDGVGKEVASEAVEILNVLSAKYGFRIRTEQFDWGCDYWLKTGSMMPENMLKILKDFNALFLGCIGDARKVPDYISLDLLLEIRKGFDQYVNLRPIKLYPNVKTPVKTATPETVDMVVVRENTEGEYSGIGGVFKAGQPEATATQVAVFTQKGCERIIQYAFELARRRRKWSRQNPEGKVTNCTKSNALNYSMVFWDSVYKNVAKNYPEIGTDVALVDALTMWLVKKPDYFDVIVASNLFGDIITDLGAVLQGGMGFAASANINPQKRYPSMFEPIHGSAPKYEGKGIVNPIAAIESIRLMMDHLGETEAALDIEDSITTVLSQGKVKTRDMGGDSSTADMGSAIRTNLLEGSSC